MRFNKKLLFAILVFVIGILVLSLFQISRQQPKKEQTPTSKTQGTTPSKLSADQLNKIKGKGDTSENTQLAKQKIINNPLKKGNDYYTLAENSSFNIVYFLIPSDDFYVTISAKPYDTAKKAAEKWFTDKGISASDLCTLGVTFIANSKVFTTTESAQFTRQPSGCPARPTP